MQRSSAENGGFTRGTPWLAVNPNHAAIHVEAQERDADSVLHFYRKRLNLRSGSETLIYGAYRPLWMERPRVFACTRALRGETFTVVCNMTGEEARLPAQPAGIPVLCNPMDGQSEPFAPYAARVYRAAAQS